MSLLQSISPMKIHLLSVGSRMPGWVQQGYQEYAKRLPAECALHLVEIPLVRRGKRGGLTRQVQQESERMLKAIPQGSRVIALEVEGRQWTTPQLSRQLGDWMGEGREIALLVGGPDGLAADCRKRAEQQWSLSNLTLPHPLVRVLLAEQLYRAWSLLRNHPYHRA